MKKLLIPIIAALLLFCTACQPSGGGGVTPTPEPGGDEPDPYCVVTPVEYDVKSGVTDMAAFWQETRDNYGIAGETSHDGKLDYGVIKDVLHTLKINGQVVGAYSTRCGFDVHSFAKIEVDTNVDVAISAEVTLLTASAAKCVVLPEKKGVTATMTGNVAKAVLNGYGDFTFVFDDKPDYALTVYVAEKEAFELPAGYQKTEIAPGTYDREALTFSEGNRAYYFKKGNYDVTSITVPSDSVVYFESGAFLKFYEAADGDSFNSFGSIGTKNIKVYGSGLFDFSGCTGGDVKTKMAFQFENVENIEVKDIISVNSHTWTMCFWYCRDIKVSELMLFGYRTYSDGVMLSDCNGAVVSDCFVRTGDDAMEVKSFYYAVPQGFTTVNDVLYENNTVWTDKGNAYGLIFEANRNASNVRFINNSVGFAQSNWIDRLGVCIIQMGTNKNARWEDVYFENIEIFRASHSLCTLYNRASGASEGGQIRNIYFKNIYAKHILQTYTQPYAINIIVSLGDAAAGNNCIIGNSYYDNIKFGDTAVTPENYLSVSRVDIADAAKPFFSNNYIKINTLA